MKQIVLERLTLRNFKGIREFVLDAQGANVAVFGDNAAGKTTLFDAFTWLLFDKDSDNKKDFEIKTLQELLRLTQSSRTKRIYHVMIDIKKRSSARTTA